MTTTTADKQMNTPETESKPVLKKARVKTLSDRVFDIDHVQGRRFAKLSGKALEIATEGIKRHLRACERMDVPFDPSAVREIIDDATSGRKFFD